MATYVFVGSLCEIDMGRIKLERFGQKVDLPSDLAVQVVLGGGAILPEADFQKIGFTEDDLEKYAFPGPRDGAPEGFKAKLARAWAAVADFRAMCAGTPEGEE